jgi:hypothetical protein
MYEGLPQSADEAEAALCQTISRRLSQGLSAAQVDDAIGLERGTVAELVAAYGVVRRSPSTVASAPSRVNSAGGSADDVQRLLDVLA